MSMTQNLNARNPPATCYEASRDEPPVLREILHTAITARMPLSLVWFTRRGEAVALPVAVREVIGYTIKTEADGTRRDVKLWDVVEAQLLEAE